MFDEVWRRWVPVRPCIFWQPPSSSRAQACCSLVTSSLLLHFPDGTATSVETVRTKMSSSVCGTPGTTNDHHHWQRPGQSLPNCHCQCHLPEIEISRGCGGHHVVLAGCGFSTTKEMICFPCGGAHLHLGFCLLSCRQLHDHGDLCLLVCHADHGYDDLGQGQSMEILTRTGRTGTLMKY